MYATQRKLEQGEDVRVVTIGSTNELPDAIDEHLSLIQWADRLTTLTEESKEHSMNYMLDYNMRKRGHEHYHWNLDVSR